MKMKQKKTKKVKVTDYILYQCWKSKDVAFILDLY